MKVSLVYVYPLLQLRRYFPLASRFVKTYQQFPAGYDHELTVICNGRQPSEIEVDVFRPIEHNLMVHDNSGWDIGAFQRFGDHCKSDLLVCFGANIHFHRAGWLDRMIEAVLNFGPGLYGCAAYQTPQYHIRTTSFWCPPEILQSYPAYIGTSKASRYEFEHGKTSFTKHVLGLGYPCMMVTWSGYFPFPNWTKTPYLPVVNGAPGPQDIIVRDQFIHG